MVPAVMLRGFAALAVAVTLGAAGCGGSGAPGDDLVTVSSRDGDYAIFGMDADGGSQGRLTDEQGDPSTRAGVEFQLEPAWSPDGSRIAFVSAREGSHDVYVMNADGTGTTRLTSATANDRHPTWSPDGERIAFARDSDAGHLFVMNADGSEQRRVTDDVGSEGEPSWSPDGAWIAYTRRPPGTDVREIWLVRPDGSDRRRLTALGGEAYTPSWSPDGTRIAFAANAGGRTFGIYTIAADGGRPQRLTSRDADAFEPAWSPDGSTIAFSRDGAIVTIDLQGNEAQLTDAQNNDSSPAWNPAPDAGGEES